jgi:purine-binding chemotaxis protein CheW
MSELQQLVDARAGGTQSDLYLTFTIGEEVYGIGIGCVKEIIGLQPIAEIPDLPEHVKGVINLRGSIIPVMDVRLRFGKPTIQYDSRTCIIVVDAAGAQVGLIVDRVSEVAAIPEGEIVPPPAINRREAGYIRGLGKNGSEIKRLLDLEILLGGEAVILNEGAFVQ